MPGATAGIYGIRNAGLAISVGTWSSLIVISSFFWGIFVFGEGVKSVHGACAAAFVLVIGLVGMSVYSAPVAAGSGVGSSTPSDNKGRCRGQTCFGDKKRKILNLNMNPNVNGNSEENGNNGEEIEMQPLLTRVGTTSASAPTSPTSNGHQRDEDDGRDRDEESGNGSAGDSTSKIISTATNAAPGRIIRRTVAKHGNGEGVDDSNPNNNNNLSLSDLHPSPSSDSTKMIMLMDNSDGPDSNENHQGGGSYDKGMGKVEEKVSLFRGKVKLTRRQLGIIGAVINGVWGSNSMIPMHYAR